MVTAASRFQKTIPHSAMSYKYFKIEEFDCSETGENRMDPQFIERMDELRERCGFPLVVVSGFRSKRHSIEAAKDEPGGHTRGKTCDVECISDRKRYTIIKHAMDLGFTEVSVGPTFIHLGMDRNIGLSWTYYGG